MKPVHFYHVHESGWPRVSREHFAALSDSGFDGDVYVGLVGSSLWRDELRSAYNVVAEADEGFEQVTLRKLHAFAKEADPDTPIMYAHTKGSWHVYPAQDAWRICMTKYVVRNWRDCLSLLDTHDAVGAHWSTVHYAPMFAGNFWWARADYLARLPELGDERHHAEMWVGQNDPLVVNLGGATAFGHFPQCDAH